jgi:hypothetical protein
MFSAHTLGVPAARRRKADFSRDVKPLHAAVSLHAAAARCGDCLSLRAGSLSALKSRR